MAFNVLCIKSKRENYCLLQQLLERCGYHVLCAANGLEVIVMAATNPIDVVILDVHQPMIDSFQVLKNLRQQDKFKNLPIIALGEESIATRAEYLQAGFTEYISKPIMQHDLNRLIETTSARGLSV